MATTLTLATGPLTAQVAAADDTKAQEVIRRFALETGAPANATNQQLLDHATSQLKEFMVRMARRNSIREAEQAAQEAANNVGF